MSSGNYLVEAVMDKEETVQGTRVALVLGILALALAVALALVACVAAAQP